VLTWAKKKKRKKEENYTLSKPTYACTFLEHLGISVLRKKDKVNFEKFLG